MWKLMLGCLAATVAAAADSAAILVAVEGTVTVSESGGTPAAARAFDWLQAGAAIETGAGSRAVIALGDGQRFEIRERTRANVTESKVEAASGEVRALAKTAAIPRMAGIDPATGSARRGGAVRVRGPQLAHCDPGPRSAVLPGETRFRFEPAAAVSRYLVEVQAADGSKVYRGESANGEVTLPAELLAAGSVYSWSVTGAGLPAGVAPPRCEAAFSTLSAEAARQREAFAASLDRSSADSLLLLAEVDRRLGLLRQARAELRQAGSDPKLRADADRIAARLREK